MKKEISIVWFRQDLRVADNPALIRASKEGDILPIYILDDCAPKPFKVGSASKVWLHHSLEKLNQSLNDTLNLYIGKAEEVIQSLIKEYSVKKVLWNKCYEPWHLDQESNVKELCDENSIEWEAFNSNYLRAPDEIIKDDGSHYKIFTAYKNKSYSTEPRATMNKADNLSFIKDSSNKTSLSDLNLIPKEGWYKKIENSWEIGEVAARKKLNFFIENHLSGYKEARNYPAKEQSSKLSPHLHFGEISPSQILESIDSIGHLYANEADIEYFLNELIWREFSCHLLYHFKLLHQNNFNSKFNSFPWDRSRSSLLKAWQSGNTGYPSIDAGMRQLWQTGYLHNRVRMVVASFLVKNLNIHWHLGQDWFWDCLVDADLADNSNNWQWVAGCGVDPAPYFRIFSPVIQGEKFDSDGEYTRKFVPELKNMPNNYLFKPWQAPEKILKSAGVVLGKTYPKPIIDLGDSRGIALERYGNL